MIRSFFRCVIKLLLMTFVAMPLSYPAACFILQGTSNSDLLPGAITLLALTHFALTLFIMICCIVQFVFKAGRTPLLTLATDVILQTFCDLMPLWRRTPKPTPAPPTEPAEPLRVTPGQQRALLNYIVQQQEHGFPTRPSQ